MILKELTESLNSMQILLDKHGKNSEIYFDHQSLNALKISSMAFQGEEMEESLLQSNKLFEKIERNQQEGMFFKRSDVYFYEGVNYFYLGQFEKALKLFKKSLDLKKHAQDQKEENFKKEREL